MHNEGDLPGAGGEYRVAIFDVQGRHVATILEQLLTPGDHSYAWDGRRSDGFTVGAGVYFVRATGPGFSQNAKIVVVR